MGPRFVFGRKKLTTVGGVSHRLDIRSGFGPERQVMLFREREPGVLSFLNLVLVLGYFLSQRFLSLAGANIQALTIVLDENIRQGVGNSLGECRVGVLI